MNAVGMLSVPSTMEDFDFIQVGLFGINEQTLASIRLDAPPQPFHGLGLPPNAHHVVP